MTNGPERAPFLVVISFFDQRPAAPLNALLTQLADVPAGAAFDTLLVCNRTPGGHVTLAPEHEGVARIDRENAGFNIGAWQAGWQARPDHAAYLFLQDECELKRPGWLAAFERALHRPRTGLVGESMHYAASWADHARRYPPIHAQCEVIAATEGIDLGATSAHLQSLIIAAKGDVLRQVGGFIERDDKVAAMAAEVMSSVRVRNAGFVNRQVARRPFEYIGHPQWNAAREASGGAVWAVKNGLRRLTQPRR